MHSSGGSQFCPNSLKRISKNTEHLSWKSSPARTPNLNLCINHTLDVSGSSIQRRGNIFFQVRHVVFSDDKKKVPKRQCLFQKCKLYKINVQSYNQINRNECQHIVGQTPKSFGRFKASAALLKAVARADLAPGQASQRLSAARRRAAGVGGPARGAGGEGCT